MIRYFARLFYGMGIAFMATGLIEEIPIGFLWGGAFTIFGALFWEKRK